MLMIWSYFVNALHEFCSRNKMVIHGLLACISYYNWLWDQVHETAIEPISQMNFQNMVLFNSRKATCNKFKLVCSHKAVACKVFDKKMVKLPFNLIIFPLIKPQVANQQQQQKNYFKKSPDISV